jgi:aminoglycoside 3-N-acetyltransferase
MKDIELFRTTTGDPITTSELLRLLEKVRAPEAEILFMHTGMTFGAPGPSLKRQELLEHLYALIAELRVPNLLVPTFTFSFCNGEDYDVQGSRSRMGALNEHIRRLPGAIRSADPLMSSVLIGKERALVEGLGHHSIGAECTFDRIHARGARAKFLFFGTTVSECFTYTHYVEERIGSPYRYQREFRGKITDAGKTRDDAYTLFVRYKGVVPNPDGRLERTLLERGLLRKEACGASSISCVDEADGYAVIAEQLREDPYAYILSDPRDRNTEFTAHNMVAL